MPADPTAPARHVDARSAALYRSAVQQASAGGAVLMGKLIASARLVLQTQEAASRDLRERDAFAESANLLRKHEQMLCQAYPLALLQVFTAPDGLKRASSLNVSEVHFDQLELMDESQVLSTVTLARVQQAASLATESSLAELNTLVSSLLGMERVQADANVLRPEAYVRALQEVLVQTQVSHGVQVQWLNAMGNTLGQELRTLYANLIRQLRQDGVVSVTYAMPHGRPGRSGSGANGVVGPAQGPTPQQGVAVSRPPPQVRGKDQALLTLDKLRKLLAGELTAEQPASRVEQFAAQFSQQFEDAEAAAQGPDTDFDATLPAALEALTEMKQVERVVQSLEQRRSKGADHQKPQAHTVEGQRQALRRDAKDTAQALSLEVVTLMVDNMARDPRLLEPVRQVIRNLEPALLRLALVDPRFFTDKQHSARRLLQAVSHHSMAFESRDAAGFDTFYKGLQNTLAPLFNVPVENADVFEMKLSALQHDWANSTRATAKDHEVAVEVLRHAEARNLLAERVAHGIEAHPDSAKVPPVVTDFLCGPWAQVVAQARIKQGAGSAAAEKFEALIPAMLWSAHPDLARANPAKLTRLVPRLLPTLREGLDTIHYPGTRTSVFLEALMAIHQQVFRPNAVVVPEANEPKPQPPILHEWARTVESGNPWIAPEEAAASNFVELEASSPASEASDAPLLPDMLIVSAPAAEVSELDMPLGSWVEMLTNDQWVRTQLTWASPHGTLFLFTGVFGTTQSMSRRLRDKLVVTGKLRLLSRDAFVDGALDAVAQTAIRNSVDTVI